MISANENAVIVTGGGQAAGAGSEVGQMIGSGAQVGKANIHRKAAAGKIAKRISNNYRNEPIEEIAQLSSLSITEFVIFFPKIIDTYYS